MFSLRVDDEVELELVDEHHAEALYALTDRNRDHLAPWMPWVATTTSVADTMGFVTFSKNEHAAGRATNCALRYRGEVVGTAGLRLDANNKRAELGYWVDKAHEGKGIVTRASRALTDAAFGELGMNRVEIHAGVENVRSRAVPERLGFVLEGVLRQYEKVGDRFVDHACYAALASEWAGTLPG
jgi:ribosomal-protein-serine acetyltransferase